MTEESTMIEKGLAEILAKDDTAIMLDWLQELFGKDVDVDSRFTIAQMLTAMDSAHKRAVEHMKMVQRAKDRAPSTMIEKIALLDMTPSGAYGLPRWKYRARGAAACLVMTDQPLTPEFRRNTAQMLGELSAAIEAMPLNVLREALERLVEAGEQRRVEDFDPSSRVTVLETRTKDILDFHEALDEARAALESVGLSGPGSRE